jgi:hypothetical protein
MGTLTARPDLNGACVTLAINGLSTTKFLDLLPTTDLIIKHFVEISIEPLGSTKQTASFGKR